MSEPTLSLKLGENATADPAKLQQMVLMGIDQAKAAQALILCQNRSVEEAVEYLTTHNQEIEDRLKVLANDPIAQYREQMAKKHDQQAKEQQQALQVQKASAASSSAPVSLNHTLKLKGDSDEAKAAFAKKQAEREYAEKQKEREKKKQQVNALRTKLAAEKAERAEKNKVRSQKVEETLVQQAPAASAPKEQAKVIDVTLQIRLPDGSALKYNLPSDQTLQQIAEFIMASSKDLADGAFSIMTPFNRKDYQADVFATTSLSDAQLVPRGAIVVTKTANKGVVKKGDGGFVAPNAGIGAPPLLFPPALPPAAVPQPAPVQPDVEMAEPSDEMTLLCGAKWVASTEECIVDQGVLVFRHESYQFPAEKPRDIMQFFLNGNCAGFDAESQSTNRGSFKLKEVDDAFQLEVSLVGKPFACFDVMQITDEVLIVKLAQ